MEEANSKEEIKRGAELLEKLANPEKDKEEKTIEEPKEKPKEEVSTNNKEKPTNLTEDQRKKIEEIARKIIKSD